MAADLLMQANMSDGTVMALERLSALVDGELDAAGASASCARWREDDAVRVAWHRYQLIGDVLRSDDLVSTPGRDEAFLVALRSRLAHEPVVLAPGPLAAPVAIEPVGARRTGRRSWAAPSAVAAGFVAVAGVLLVVRGPDMPGTRPSNESARVASAQTAGVPSAASPIALISEPLVQPANAPFGAFTFEPSGQSAALIEPQPPLVNGRFIRDAGLDRYLAAHQQFAGTSALGVPSAFLRSATADMSNR